MRLFSRLLLVCLIGHSAPAFAETTEPTADRTLISAEGADPVRSRLAIPAFPLPNQLDADWQREYKTRPGANGGEAAHCC